MAYQMRGNAYGSGKRANDQKRERVNEENQAQDAFSPNDAVY